MRFKCTLIFYYNTVRKNFKTNKYLKFYRGQESAGIAMSEGDNHTHFNVKKGMGLVSNIFNDEATKKLKGNNYQFIKCIGQLLFSNIYYL